MQPNAGGGSDLPQNTPFWQISAPFSPRSFRVSVRSLKKFTAGLALLVAVTQK
jgi:hypothetical protein